MDQVKKEFGTDMNTRRLEWRKAGKERFTVVIAGDFCPREENSADAAARAVEITAAVKPFFDDADLRLLQWECAVTKQETPIDKSGPNHRCYPECTAFAEALGIDAVLLANNHTGDYGAPGVKDTLETFRRLGIGTVGAGMNEAEALRPLRVEIRGKEFSFLNAAEYEFGIACGDKPGACPLDTVRIARQIREEKEAGRPVVVTLHGGHEHFPYPSPRMRSLFRFFADCGAAAVFNCHTHCPLGYEIWRGVPIVYSPGNFYFPPRPASLPCWYIGYVPKFFFDEQGACALELLPYFNLKRGLSLPDAEESEKFFAYLDELSAPIGGDEALLQKIFDAWCSRSGVSALNGLFDRAKPASLRDPESVKSNLGLRNLFTCHSHNDMLRNTLLLMERYGLEAAEAGLPLIDAARNPAWLEKTAVARAVEEAAAR